MKLPLISALVLTLGCVFLPGCQTADGESASQHVDAQVDGGEEGAGEHGKHTITVIHPIEQNVVITQEYVCQIHSRTHVDVCSLDGGYLQEVHVREGQAVKKGELMFKILPVVYQAKLDTEIAEAEQAQIEYNNTEALYKKNVVSKQELALVKAKLDQALAQVDLAKAELSFTDITAPFDGIIDRQMHQQGSLIEEGEILTTLSDNDVMWVYFNVPEARYLEYMSNQGARDPEHPQQLHLPGAQIEVRLADGSVFNQTAGDIVTVEGNFDNETGNIAFRADFPNPEHLLRHGQTGTILIHRTLKDAIVIPQRATYEILDKQFVFVVEGGDAQPVAEGSQPDAAERDGRPTNAQESAPAAAQETEHVAETDAEQHHSARPRGRGVARQRHIEVEHEKDDVFIIRSGLSANDQIVLEGVRQVHDGQETEYEVENPEEVFANLKYHAE